MVYARSTAISHFLNGIRPERVKHLDPATSSVYSHTPHSSAFLTTSACGLSSLHPHDKCDLCPDNKIMTDGGEKTVVREEGMSGEKWEDKVGDNDFNMLLNARSLIMLFHGEVLEGINMAPCITA